MCSLDSTPNLYAFVTADCQAKLLVKARPTAILGSCHWKLEYGFPISELPLQ